MSWLPLTLARTEAQQVVRIVQTLANRGQAFVQTPDVRRAAAVILGYLQKQPPQKVLILAPTVRDVQLLKSRLTGMTPLILTGEETQKERFETWTEFRRQPEGLLLGTRTALLAIDSSITTIFLLRSGDINHKSRDRNPRYDVRELVFKHRHAFGSSIFYLDVAPQSFSCLRFHDTERLNWGTYPRTHIVNMNQERGASPSELVCHSSLQAIGTALDSGKQVVCVYNRKNHWMECLRCQTRSVKADHCQSCGGINLKIFSHNNQDVARELARLFPEHSVAVIDKDHPKLVDADILIVTTFYAEAYADPFRKTSIGLVLHLTVDAPLYASNISGVEELLRDVWQWAWVAFGARAPFVVETASEDLLREALDHPFELAQSELEARERYHLPPYYRWVSIVYKGDTSHRAAVAMTTVRAQITAIPSVIVHPLTTTKQGLLRLEFGVPLHQFDALLQIFTALPDRYIIDTNAMYV
jgi:primosomal protein N'